MEKLFVYGTLKEAAVQKEVFDRVVNCKDDVLQDYVLSKIKLEKIYPVIIPKRGSVVNGLVISVTQKELELIDAYETQAYQRIKVVLRSGIEAWVYVKNKN